MDHTEAIIKFDNIIDKKIIDNLIEFIKVKAIEEMIVGKGMNKDIRNVRGYTILPESFCSATDQAFFNYVKSEVLRLYPLYKTKFPLLLSNKLNQIDFLKYDVGGKYTIHTDHFTTNPRALSIIANLNDDYEGGDLIFTDQKGNEIKRYQLKKGSIIFFPSNFLYPHSIEPITKGTRYSLVAWLQ